MRLTYKLEEPIITTYLHFDYMRIADYDIKRGNYGKITQDEIYNKLGQFEDIEEELGVDLITLLNALNIGVYYYKKRINFAKGYRVKLRISDKMLYIDKHTHLYFKDYGKTWALTKEEL